MQDPTDKGKVLNRTWTISSHPSEQTSEKAFSISVKEVGLISDWLHTSFNQGGVLEWRGVEGAFTPQEHAGPALLIAGGIGELCCPLPQHCCTLAAEQEVSDPAASVAVSIMPHALQMPALTRMHTALRCASEGLCAVITATCGCCHASTYAPDSSLSRTCGAHWTYISEAEPL